MRLLERYATFYVPIMLTAAAVLLFVTRDMSRAVTLLVVACPGAFVLAGPTAMIAALAAASRLGILVKNTKFLEVLANVDTVVLDKTGTVTLGHLEVVAVRLHARFRGRIAAGCGFVRGGVAAPGIPGGHASRRAGGAVARGCPIVGRRDTWPRRRGGGK